MGSSLVRKWREEADASPAGVSLLRCAIELERALAEAALAQESRGPCSACGDGDTEMKYHSHGAAQGSAGAQDEGCICQGNWRKLVAKIEPLIGHEFIDESDRRWQLFGLVHTDEDYYYGMIEMGGTGSRLLSCVGSIEGHGYKRVAAQGDE